MLQGSPKKIEVDLLLSDLALQLRYPALRRRQLVLPRLPAPRRRLAWAAHTTQRCRAALPVLVAPLVQSLAIDLQIPRNPRHALARRYARNRTPLQLGPILSMLLHQFLSSRNCPHYSCLTFGGHSKSNICNFYNFWRASECPGFILDRSCPERRPYHRNSRPTKMA